MMGKQGTGATLRKAVRGPMDAPAGTAVNSRGRWVALVGVCVAAGLVWLAFADLRARAGRRPIQ
jgi:hypothetical protein